MVNTLLQRADDHQSSVSLHSLFIFRKSNEVQWKLQQKLKNDDEMSVLDTKVLGSPIKRRDASFMRMLQKDSSMAGDEAEQ
jgi:hypothetical protein